jgi:hypothetical protein
MILSRSPTESVETRCHIFSDVVLDVYEASVNKKFWEELIAYV